MRKLRKKLFWLLAVATGLCGGWLAAGALNDHRIDIPRPFAPASQPSPGGLSH